MAQTVREVMTPNPRTIDAGASITEAAKIMQDADVGSVLVREAGTVTGIVTDRDIAIRAIAEDKDPQQTKVAEICSEELTTISPDAEIGEVVKEIRESTVRRLPVVEEGKPVGIVSLGDLAVERDPDSALAEVSAAPPNK